MKKCFRCGVKKPESNFCKSKNRVDGLSTYCLECHRAICKKYYLKKTGKSEARKNIGWKSSIMINCRKCGKEFLKRASSKTKYCSGECYRKRNILIGSNGIILKKCKKCGKIKPLTQEYFCRVRNRNGILNRFVSYCKVCLNKINNRWRSTERGKFLRIESFKRNIETTRQYKEKTKPQRRQAENLRQKIDPSFALKNRIRILMYATLRKTKNGRKWQNLVGYSIKDLRRHIEKNFKEGMTWEKFMAGEIHIDHIVPVSAFNYKSPEDFDFKRCWALKNLRPMWAADNRKKHARFDKAFQPSLIYGDK